MKYDWDDPFLGCSRELLIQRLRESDYQFRLDRQYSKIFDTIQSTGMGKSRLVHEVCFQIMSVCFVLRRTGEAGFPLGDDEVYAFLTGGAADDYKDAHLRATALLGATFTLGKWLSLSEGM